MTLWHPSSAAVGAIVIVFMCATSKVASAEGRDEPHKYTIEELITTHFENKQSNDLGMDPCKAGKLYCSILIMTLLI